MAGRRLAAAAILVALAAAGIAARWLWPSPALVFIDNGSAEDVLVYRDGDPALSVPRYEFRALRLASGRHRLGARSVAGVVDQQTIDARRGQKWIWNVAGKNRYAVYTMTYGQDRAVDAPREVGAGERLFAQPPDVAVDFMQPLPPSVTVGGGDKSAQQKALYHLPLHADRPCCVEIIKLAGQTK
jgi:hypothetical protein